MLQPFMFVCGVYTIYKHVYLFFNFLFLSRSQLTVIVSNVIKYDYPDKWPNVIDKIQLHMQGDNHRAWMGALLTLYQLVKNYEYVCLPILKSQ